MSKINNDSRQEGWVKVPRCILEMDDYFGERFSRTRCWLDLLLLAEWKPSRSFRIRGAKVELKRGQVAISGAELAKRWNLNRSTVIARLEEFEREGMIKIEHSMLINILTIVDYNKYQDKVEDTESDTPADASTYQQQTQQLFQQQSQQQTQQQTQQLSLRIDKKEQEKEKTSSSSRARGFGPEVEGSDSLFDYFFAENRLGSVEQMCIPTNLDPPSCTGGATSPNPGKPTNSPTAKR